MKEIMTKLEEYIAQYDCVLVFQDNSSVMKRICSLFCSSKALESTGKSIMIMATSEYTPINGKYRRLTAEEYGIIQESYNLYEFSNRLQIISENCQYGSLLHYIRTGLMSEEQICEALLS